MGNRRPALDKSGADADSTVRGERAAALLAGLVVINLARGFVAAVAGKLLSDFGADVHGPPIGGEDPAAAFYPAYRALRAQETPVAAETLEALYSTADICIIGGEDFPGTPPADTALPHQAAANPNLIVLRISGYPDRGPDAGKPAVDILVQARSGLTFEHYSDRANLMAFQPTQYGAALQGIIGALAATFARNRGAGGQTVSTSLYQGALSWMTTWGLAEHSNPEFDFTTPIDPRPLILECADGGYLHIVLGSAGSKYLLYQILGIADPTVKVGDSGAPDKNDPPEKFYGDVDLLAPYVAKWRLDELAKALTDAGIVAAPVLSPGLCWSDPQILHDQLIVARPDGTAIVGPPAFVRVSDRAGPSRGIEPGAPDLPLAGIRVVDFGAFTAGPLASLLLSRLGADVVKVEPLSGDPCRNLARAFMAANRGKRSIVLDMKSNEGRETAAGLIADADIVVSNFRTGVAAKLGIDGASLVAKHPELIVLECPAFGQTGPRAHEVAFDLVMQAFCGFEERAGGVGNVPIWNRTFLSDYGGGQLGALTLIAALDHRLRTGRGAVIEVSLLRSAMFLQSEAIRLANGRFAGTDLLDPNQTGFHPAESLYRALNGWIAIAIRDGIAAERLRKVLRIEGAISQDWRNWAAADRENIAGAIALRATDELLSTLEAAGVWAELCRSGMERETLTDDRLVSIGVVEHVDTRELGKVAHVGSLFDFSRSRQAAPARAPRLGAHTAAIRSEIDLAKETRLQSGQNDSDKGALPKFTDVGK